MENYNFDGFKSSFEQPELTQNIYCSDGFVPKHYFSLYAKPIPEKDTIIIPKRSLKD